MADKTLNEGKWLSKIKDLINPKPIPTYTVELTCYPPFKEEPVVWKIDNVYDLDDERIQRAYESIRRQHPKSPIRLRSPLGNKTFYENSSSEYELKVYSKEDDRVDTFGAGTLPQAMAMCEKLWNANPDSYKNIEVIHNNDVVTNYNALQDLNGLDIGRVQGVQVLVGGHTVDDIQGVTGIDCAHTTHADGGTATTRSSIGHDVHTR